MHTKVTLLAYLVFLPVCMAGPLSGEKQGSSPEPTSTLTMTTPKPKHDLSLPDYCPPHVPGWARVDYPARVQPFVGINGMPPAWQEKFETANAMNTAGIDRYQANNFINWRPETAEFIRNAYTPTTVGYVSGTLPDLEKLAGECTRGLRTNVEKAEAILMGPGKILKHPFVPQIGDRAKGDRDLDEQGLLESGTAWCNEQARVFVRLCQTQNIPARLIHLFYSTPPVGHTVAEFYDGSGWCMVDASYFIVFRDKDGRALSAADCHDRGAGQARAGELWFAAISALVAEASSGQAPEMDARLVAWLKNQEGKSPETCSAELDFFGVMNYPLPGH